MLVNLYLKPLMIIACQLELSGTSDCSCTYTEWLSRRFINRLQLIARPLLMRTKLPIYAWGHAILHAAAFVRIRSTANHQQSPFQLVLGQIPNFSHLRVFGCTIQVPIAPPQCTKMGPQRRSGIYIGFDSASII